MYLAIATLSAPKQLGALRFQSVLFLAISGHSAAPMARPSLPATLQFLAVFITFTPRACPACAQQGWHFPRPMYGITLWPPWAPQIVGRAAVSVPWFSQSVATDTAAPMACPSLPAACDCTFSVISFTPRACSACARQGWHISTTPVWDHALATQTAPKRLGTPRFQFHVSLNKTVATPLPAWRAPRSLPRWTAVFLSLLSLRVAACVVCARQGWYNDLSWHPRNHHPRRRPRPVGHTAVSVRASVIQSIQ